MGNIKRKPTFELWEVLLIAFISSLIMSLSTGYVVYRNQGTTDCSKLATNPHLGEIINTYNSLLNDYYAEVNEQELKDAAISGMMNYLDDPYTTYLNENNSDYLRDTLKGTYEGVGIQLFTNEEGLALIEKVFSGSPAAKAGVKSGDIIKRINSVEAAGKTATELVEIIRGSEDPNVTLTVDRNGELLTFNLERTTLFIPVVEEAVFENNNQKVGYLNVSRFSDTVGEQFKNKLQILEKQSINSLIIDLRGNTGGYLNGATDIAELFLKPGSVIYSLKSKMTTTSTKASTQDFRSYKVYILINKGSASASEILAAALRYSYDKTLLVGETSYGKGKVQHTSDLISGSMLKYTTAEWLTPKGDCVEGIGLIPDVKVTLTEGVYPYPLNKDAGQDNQLQTAIFEITK